jgi:hypothetical protein
MRGETKKAKTHKGRNHSKKAKANHNSHYLLCNRKKSVSMESNGMHSPIPTMSGLPLVICIPRQTAKPNKDVGNRLGVPIAPYTNWKPGKEVVGSLHKVIEKHVNELDCRVTHILAVEHEAKLMESTKEKMAWMQGQIDAIR